MKTPSQKDFARLKKLRAKQNKKIQDHLAWLYKTNSEITQQRDQAWRDTQDLKAVVRHLTNELINRHQSVPF